MYVYIFDSFYLKYIFPAVVQVVPAGSVVLPEYYVCGPHVLRKMAKIVFYSVNLTSSKQISLPCLFER